MAVTSKRWNSLHQHHQSLQINTIINVCTRKLWPRIVIHKEIAFFLQFISVHKAVEVAEPILAVLDTFFQ